jgi:polysaccharide transporter, PST family
MFKKLSAVRERFKGRIILQHSLRNTGWLVGERTLRLVFGLFVSILVARYLGPNDFGILSYVVAFVALVQPLGTLGLNHVITRDIVEAPGDSGEVLGTAALLRFFGSLIATLLAVLAIRILRPEDDSLLIFVAVLSLAQLFRALEVIDFWFQAYVRAKYAVYARSFALVTSGGLKFAFVALQAPLAAFVAAVALESILAALALGWIYRRHRPQDVRWRKSWRRAQTLLTHAWPLILSSMGVVVYLKIDQVMLGQMLSDEAVGIYAVAVRLSEVWYVLPTAVTASVFPALINLRARDEGRYQNRLQTGYDVLALAAYGVAVPVTIFASWIINVLYGEAYAGAGTVLAMHVWGALFVFMRALFSKWLIAERLLIFSLVTHGSGAAVNVALNIALIPAFGGNGAAFASVVSYAVAGYASLFLNGKTRDVARMMTKALFAPLRISAIIRDVQRIDFEDERSM